MEEDIKKIREQQKIEKENYKIIEATINTLAKTIDTDQYYQLIKLIREDRKEIYELKVGLGEKISESYLKKNGEILTELLKFVNEMSKTEPHVSILPLIFQRSSIEVICNTAKNRNEYPIYTITKHLLDIAKKGRPSRVECTVIKNEDESKTLYKVDIDNIGMSPCAAQSFFKKYSFFKEYYTSTDEILLDEENIKNYAKGKIVLEDDFIRLFNKYTDEKNGSEVREKHKKIEDDAIRTVNLKVLNDIIQYLEREKEYWENRNLEIIEDVEVDYE